MEIYGLFDFLLTYFLIWLEVKHKIFEIMIIMNIASINF